MVSSFFHHGDGAPQWRAWGPPTGPIPVTGRPYSGMGYFRMYRKAVPLAESIGGFIKDEFMIAMGDMAKIIFKMHFLAGPTLKIITSLLGARRWLDHQSTAPAGHRHLVMAPWIFVNTFTPIAVDPRHQIGGASHTGCSIPPRFFAWLLF